MTADELFSIDLDGQRQSFDDLLGDGLDRDYSERFPALRELVAHGSPRDALFAATMLTSWAVRDGYLAILRWSADPTRVPWADAPWVHDRFTGVDAAFAMLARAIHHAAARRHTEAAALLRASATRALLGVYHRVFFDRDLLVLLSSDGALARRCQPELEAAVELATRASSEQPAFDMATQAAFLLGPLSRLDDEHAARAADTLLARHPQHARAAREVAHALAAGTGPATLAVLERMAQQTAGSVRAEAEQSLARRGDQVLA